MKEESQKQKMKSNEEILTGLGSLADSSKDELVGKQMHDSICKAMDLAREDERSRHSTPISKENIEEIRELIYGEIYIVVKTRRAGKRIAESKTERIINAISHLSIQVDAQKEIECEHYYVPIGEHHQNGKFICTKCKNQI